MPYHYSILEASQIVGIPKETIRKWEQRYDFLAPIRSANGYRRYTQQDVLLLLQVVSYLRQRVPLRVATTKLTKQEPANARLTDYLFNMLIASTLCDENRLYRLLKEAHITLNLDDFMHRLVMPFLHQIGDNWQHQTMGPHQEKVASTVIRDFLACTRRSMTGDPEQPLVLGACLPGEAHEIAVQISLILASTRGYRNFMIGALPAKETISLLVRHLRPAIVILSAATMAPFEHHLDEIHALDQLAATLDETNFYIGGNGAKQYLTNHTFESLIYCDSPYHLF